MHKLLEAEQKKPNLFASMKTFIQFDFNFNFVARRIN